MLLMGRAVRRGDCIIFFAQFIVVSLWYFVVEVSNNVAEFKTSFNYLSGVKYDFYVSSYVHVMW